MKTRVDRTCCQGHTLCQMAAPEVFKLGDVDGKAYVEDEEVAAELEEKVRMAAENCPEQAIVVEE